MGLFVAYVPWYSLLSIVIKGWWMSRLHSGKQKVSVVGNIQFHYCGRGKMYMQVRQIASLPSAFYDQSNAIRLIKYAQ